MRKNRKVATEMNVQLPADLLAQVQQIAQAEGISVNALAAEAVKEEVARKLIAQLRREAKPSGMTDEEELEAAVKAQHDFRRGQ